MAIDLGLFELAVPTQMQGIWMLGACAKVGLKVGGCGDYTIPFLPKPSFKPRVSVVRHPCSWLGAMFVDIDVGLCIDINFARIHDGRFDDFVRNYLKTVIDMNFARIHDGRFDDFVRNYLKTVPGEIGRICDGYKCDTRMRLEDMPWALIEFLSSLGVPKYRLERISNLPLFSGSVQWNPQLRREVLEAEEKMCSEFDYY